MVEIGNHPWFLGCQFHPEFKSKPTQAHPLFVDFVQASCQVAKLNNWTGLKNQKRVATVQEKVAQTAKTQVVAKNSRTKKAKS